jgi:hypothetical protein
VNQVAEQNITENGMRRGFEQVITYLIGAGIVGIIISLWALNSTVSRLDDRTQVQASAMSQMAQDVSKLTSDVGVLTGRLEQYANDNQRPEAAKKR